MTKCPYSNKCGGCISINESYEKQLQNKVHSVQELYPRTKIKEYIGMEDPYHYRHKVYASFGYNHNGNVRAGIYEEDSHKLIYVNDCLIQNKLANHILISICDIANELNIEAYNEDTGHGVLRHAYIRVSHASHKALVVIVIGSKELPSSKEFVKRLLQKEKNIETIVLNFNNKDTSMILGDKEKVLHGKGYIIDEIQGIKFRISTKSFYQVNPVQTENLYAKAIELANLQKRDNVLDACCGIGTISLCIANKVNSVTGVEISKQAISDAIYNAKLNHINNAYFYAADITEFLEDLIDRPDVVFLDPPRSGMTFEAIRSLSDLRVKKIVYISCNPETQARDVKQLIKEGYYLNKIVPVDMFPFTKHCESIALLTRVNSGRHK